MAEMLPGVVSGLQFRTLAVLSGIVILGGLSLASAITAGGLLVAEVSGSATAAGLGQTSVVLGAAALAVPLARLSSRFGRRKGLATGMAAGCLGAVVVVSGAASGQLVVLLLGLLLFGGAQATVLQARFTANDLSVPATMGRDLSLILWMSAVGAIAGPNLVAPSASTARAFGLPDLSGPFLWSAVGLLLAMVLLWAGLRPDPLVVARAQADPGEQPPRHSLGQTLRHVAALPGARLAVLAMLSANAAMVGLMVMTPVQLRHSGHTLTIVGIVISVHVAGMFLFAPVFGIMADRLGRAPVIGAGAAVLILAGLLAALAPSDTVLVGVALFLLGLGWSMCIVSASALLSASVAIDYRASAQGFADLAMGLAGAAAGILAGPIFGLGSFSVLGLVVAAISVPMLIVAPRARISEQV